MTAAHFPRPLVALLLACSALAASATTYRVADLGPYKLESRGESRGDDISMSRSGLVATTAYAPEGLRAVLYRDGERQLLGTLGGSRSVGNAVNSRGDVVGTSERADGWNHAFLWDGSETHDLGLLAGFVSFGYDVNRARQVVGGGYNADLDPRAFLYENGVMTDLGTLGGWWSHATAINENGVVAGYSDATGGNVRAFTYVNGVMTDLGALPDSIWSSASDINDEGVAVGSSWLGDSSGHHAVSFQDGRVSDLGTLGGAFSAALAINNRGHIVGWSTSDGQKASRKGRKAFLYRNGRMTPLDHMLESPDRQAWKLREATDINDHGQITGWGEHDGKYRIFLLTPIDE